MWSAPGTVEETRRGASTAAGRDTTPAGPFRRIQSDGQGLAVIPGEEETMARLRARTKTGALTVLLALAAASALPAQESLSARLEASGLVHLLLGETELAALDLNAHGPGWIHVSQAAAATEVSALPDQLGWRFTGTLPVPRSGGALTFTETVSPLPEGLRLEYEVVITEPLLLNGLQVSLSLPVARFVGQTLFVSQPDTGAHGLLLPAEQPEEQRAQLWAGEGTTVEVAPGTEQALTLQLQALADLVVQDLRQWEHAAYEIRLPAIMQDSGSRLRPGTRFRLVLTLTLPGPVRLLGP